jgi:hypothetical protein
MNPSQNQKENEFMQIFKSICQSKYAQGPTLMELFVELNNPEITMKMIEANLEALFEKGMCKISVGGPIGSTKRYYYVEPYQASEMGASSSISNSVNNLPSNEFLNQFFQTTLKTNDELKSTFHEILAVNQQMLAQQNKILEALNKNTGQIENLQKMPSPISSHILGMQPSQILAGMNVDQNILPKNMLMHSNKYDSDEEDIPPKKKSAPPKKKYHDSSSEEDNMPGLEYVPPLNMSKMKGDDLSDSDSDSEGPVPKNKQMSKQTPTLNVLEKVSNVPGSNDKMKVKSFTGGSAYDVNIISNTCSCPNYEYVQSTKNPPGQCKHLKAAHQVVGTIVN